jgi:hypothetical protein
VVDCERDVAQCRAQPPGDALEFGGPVRLVVEDDYLVRLIGERRDQRCYAPRIGVRVPLAEAQGRIGTGEELQAQASVYAMVPLVTLWRTR